MPIWGEKRKHCAKAGVQSSFFLWKKIAVTGVCGVECLALIAAWVGDKDLAFEQLERIIRLPSPLSYGDLKLIPVVGSSAR